MIPDIQKMMDNIGGDKDKVMSEVQKMVGSASMDRKRVEFPVLQYMLDESNESLAVKELIHGDSAVADVEERQSIAWVFSDLIIGVEKLMNDGKETCLLKTQSEIYNVPLPYDKLNQLIYGS